MHDEYERAMTGRNRPRLGIWGWIGLAFAGFLMTGTVLAATGFLIVKNRVERFVEQGGPEAAIARALANLEEFEEFEGFDEIEALEDFTASDEAVALALQSLVEGSLRIVGPEGERLSVDLRGDESGGSLVIDADGERVTFDLVRDGDAASLMIRSSDGDEARLNAGERAMDVPSWIPEAADRPDRPRHVYSARHGAERAGAVLWETDLAVERVAEQIVDGLERAGLSVDASSRHETRRSDHTSMRFTDRSGARAAFLVAVRSNDRTTVFLGYRDGH